MIGFSRGTKAFPPSFLINRRFVWCAHWMQMDAERRGGNTMVTLARVSLRDVLLAVTLSDGRVLLASREANIHLGLPPSLNVIGRNFMELLESQDRPDFKACVTRPSSCLLKSRSGSLLWLDVQVS
jgi:hypothetical protein